MITSFQTKKFEDVMWQFTNMPCPCPVRSSLRPQQIVTNTWPAFGMCSSLRFKQLLL
jgi:hypothetical protein